MSNTRNRTAVGAGTTAGDATDEEYAPVSRAAEAEADERLESLQTSSAAPVGAVRSTQPARPDSAMPAPIQDAAAARSPSPVATGPENPHADLRLNEAGIASRIEPER